MRKQKQFRSTMKGLLTIFSLAAFLSLVLLTDNCQPIRPAGSDPSGTLTVSLWYSKSASRGDVFFKYPSRKSSLSHWQHVFLSLQPEDQAASSDCRRLGSALCFSSPVRPAQAVPEIAPRARPLILPSKPSRVF